MREIEQQKAEVENLGRIKATSVYVFFIETNLQCCLRNYNLEGEFRGDGLLYVPFPIHSSR